MRRLLCVTLILVGCACSRRSLQAIDRVVTPDASLPVDSSPPDTRSPDTRLPDARLPDARLPDSSPPDSSPPDRRPFDTGLPDSGDTHPAVTCPSSAAQSGTRERTIVVGSVNRSYWLRIPDKYNASRPAPLLFDFHLLGMGISGQSQSSSSPYLASADSDGVVMAFPTGSAGPSGLAWNLGPCCVSDPNVDDVAFTKAIIADIQKTVCIDTNRIYAVGAYTGGGMAYTLACRASRVFAGVAVAAWDLLDKVTCNPDRPITVVSFRDPTDTSFIPYSGGDSNVVFGMSIRFLGAKKTFDIWAANDECTGSPSNDSDGCSTHSKCDGDAEVILCSKAGSPTSVSDASFAWQVLKRHSLPQD